MNITGFADLSNENVTYDYELENTLQQTADGKISFLPTRMPDRTLYALEDMPLRWTSDLEPGEANEANNGALERAYGLRMRTAMRARNRMVGLVASSTRPRKRAKRAYTLGSPTTLEEEATSIVIDNRVYYHCSCDECLTRIVKLD